MSKSRPSSGNFKPRLQFQLSLPTSLVGANASPAAAELGGLSAAAAPVSGSGAFSQTSSESLHMSPARRSLVAKQVTRSQSFKETNAEPLTLCPASKSSITSGQSVDANAG